jgi:hypothetical protein
MVKVKYIFVLLVLVAVGFTSCGIFHKCNCPHFGYNTAHPSKSAVIKG